MRLAALLGSLALSCVLSELLVLAALGVQPKFPRRVVGAPWGLRMNEPGARYRHASADVDVEMRINGQGLRADREHAREKPPGVRRIVALGDSFTIGYEVALEDCFASVLERELARRGLAAEVLNAGVSGFGSAEACLYLERELIHYQPDLVLLSFHDNDLADNVRSGLFALRGEELVPAAERYVPGGGLADALNRSRLLSLAAERSNAFAFVKEQVSWRLKQGLTAARSAPAAPGEDPAARLCVAILERMRAFLQARGIPLLIQSIPSPPGDGPLVEGLPPGLEGRPGVHVVPAKRFLDPLVGREPLYHRRSHGHWTPLAHRRSGEHLAALIVRERLLR